MNRALLIALLWSGMWFTSCGAAPPPPSLENDALAVSLEQDASLRLTDKATGVTWNVGRPRIVRTDREEQPVEITGNVEQSGDTMRYCAQDGSVFTVRLVTTPAAIDYACEPADSCLAVQLISKAIPLTPGADNYYAVPHRIGLMLRPEGTEPYIATVFGGI